MDKEVSDVREHMGTEVDIAEADTEFQKFEAHENFRIFVNKNDLVQEWTFRAIEGVCVSEGRSLKLKLYQNQDKSTVHHWFLKFMAFPKRKYQSRVLSCDCGSLLIYLFI